MDQRNAGRSRGAIAADHGWHTYAADHLALMDHLGHKRFHTLGGCIGSSYCLKLCEVAPERVSAAVLQNPIGLHPELPTYFPDSHIAWAQGQRAARPELDEAALASFGRNMWDRDFAFSVTREFVRRCTVPCLVLPGNDSLTPPSSAPSSRSRSRQHRACSIPGRAQRISTSNASALLRFLAKHTP